MYTLYIKCVYIYTYIYIYVCMYVYIYIYMPPHPEPSREGWAAPRRSRRRTRLGCGQMASTLMANGAAEKVLNEL